jgi:hypothetical protein
VRLKKNVNKRKHFVNNKNLRRKDYNKSEMPEKCNANKNNCAKFSVRQLPKRWSKLLRLKLVKKLSVKWMKRSWLSWILSRS